MVCSAVVGKEEAGVKGLVCPAKVYSEARPPPPLAASIKEAENTASVTWSKQALLAVYQKSASRRGKNPDKNPTAPSIGRAVAAALE